MNYIKNLAPNNGFVTQRLPGQKYKPLQQSRLSSSWRSKWQAFYTADIITKAVFGFYAAVLFISGYIIQHYAKVDPLIYVAFYLPASGCLWLAINSKKIMQTTNSDQRSE